MFVGLYQKHAAQFLMQSAVGQNSIALWFNALTTCLNMFENMERLGFIIVQKIEYA